MNVSMFSCRTESLNAKMGSITLAVSALATLLLSHFSVSLAPLRLLTVAVTAFAAWSFCDEMGMKKPLNRAGFVLFVVAAFTKVQLLLGLSSQYIGRYYFLYAAFLLLAVLFWSVALLHRKSTSKVIGAVGLIATFLPIATIIIGHIFLGVGAFIGVDSMFAATAGNSPTDLGFVTLVERIFGIWACTTAWLLWRGHIKFTNVQQATVVQL